MSELCHGHLSPSAIHEGQPIKSSPGRQMVRAELLGSHTHQATSGTRVHIWQRDGKYLARGRYAGEAFGETLGADLIEAAAKLRRLLVDIENGAYLRPSEKRKRPLSRNTVPQLTVRELCDEFLAEKRRTVGKKTSDTYRSRIAPVIEFSEQVESRRRWPLARDVDREFAVELKVYLHGRVVSRNGRPSAQEARTSPRQVYNILDCARTAFHWGKQPEVNKLPATFVNPLTKEIVGNKPRQDPLRPVKLPVDHRMQLVRDMDLWQLTHFAIPFVLALRPEDYVGLFISEVNFDDHLLKFSTRLGGRDFNKGRQSFVTPFPSEIEPLLRICIGQRADGPLLRSRTVFEGRRRAKLTVKNVADIGAHVDRAIVEAPDDMVQTAQDQKVLVRKLLRQMGGTSEDGLAKEFKNLCARMGNAQGIRFYDLRGSVNTDLDRAGVSKLTQLYVTGHGNRDILNEYVSLDPLREMQKHFRQIRPLLECMTDRAAQLGIRQ